MENDNAPISMSQIDQVYESRFVRVFDMHYKPGKHYMNATRRDTNNLVASKTDKEFKAMAPDAVSCFVIVDMPDGTSCLLLTKEFRYPTGRYLLSVPAGLIDKADMDSSVPAIATAKREIFEETGLQLAPTDSVKLVNPLVFSSPGMTDESNALVSVHVTSYANAGTSVENSFTQEHTQGSELFDDYILLTREQALETLSSGVDDQGCYYPAYTWMALMYFVSDMWK